jgi:hypothetical protein
MKLSACWLLAALVAIAQPSSRAESERAIRTALHDFTLGTLNGDSNTVIAISARRTVGFFDLLVEASPAGTKERMAKAGIKSGADYYASSLRVATQVAAASKMDGETIAQQTANNAVIEFRSDTEATVRLPPSGNSRAVWESNAWKIDSTESVKAPFLKSALMQQLTPEQRKRLEEY